MYHIVIISPIFATGEDDSINLPFLQLHCRELLRRGVKLNIISEQYPATNNYQWHGAQVHTIKRRTPKWIYKFFRKRKLLACLRNIHQHHPIHLIHNYWFNILGEISFEFAATRRIPHLVTLSGQDILASNPYIRKITAYRGTLVTPSLFHKKQLVEYYPVNPEVIGFGIDHIPLVKQERDIDLLLCGWVNQVKNYPLFLDIVGQLAEHGTVKKAVICGGGPLMADLKTQIASRGLSHRIVILDSVPREDVLRTMQCSKILVHTSHFESFGLVLAEALACNCHVVSRPVGIAYSDPDIVRCETAEEFVRVISGILNDYTPPDWKAASRYSIQTSVDQYMALYQRLIAAD